MQRRSAFLYDSNVFVRTLFIIVLFGINGCKKMVEVGAPITSINTNNVYTNNATASAVLTGIYTSMNSGGFASGTGSAPLYMALSSDELSLYAGVANSKYINYNQNNLSASGNGGETWNVIYPFIFICNAAIDGLAGSSGLTTSVEQQLSGEAKFMRAFFLFYLVNLYGNIPLPLTTNYQLNESLSRSPRSEVYRQIIEDLKDASSLLSINYLDATLLNTTSERLRPTKGASQALLARTYLYMGDWRNAEIYADSVIADSALYRLDSLDNVFLTTSKEAIWQLQPTNAGRNTEDAFLYILPSTGPSQSNPVYLSKFLVNSFEAGDERRVSWVDSVVVNGVTFYFPYKYKARNTSGGVSEYVMVFRLAEIYLIRAEARMNQGDVVGALADLNLIRFRSGLNIPIELTNVDSISKYILHERQVELFTEWGNRWLDLKRTSNINAVMDSVKGSKWTSSDTLYPIPVADIQADYNLVQNPGY